MTVGRGPVLILKALQRQYACYDPSLYRFHGEYDLNDSVGGVRKKAVCTIEAWPMRCGATGSGLSACFIRLHGQSSVPLTLFSKSNRAPYSVSVSFGRFEACTGRLADVTTSVPETFEPVS
jgi:hypothetical protein